MILDSCNTSSAALVLITVCLFGWNGGEAFAFAFPVLPVPQSIHRSVVSLKNPLYIPNYSQKLYSTSSSSSSSSSLPQMKKKCNIIFTIQMVYSTSSSSSSSSSSWIRLSLSNDQTTEENNSDNNEEEEKKVPGSWKTNHNSKRLRFLNMIGIRRMPKHRLAYKVRSVEDGTIKTKPLVIPVSTVAELDDYWADTKRQFRTPKKGGLDDEAIDYDSLIAACSVLGDTQMLGSKECPNIVHPVAQLLHERRRTKSPLGKREDGFHLALAIEGGGMRGCISAGMVAAVQYLGLEDAFDSVYGSSAGTIIGSYFITRQLPWFGPEIYYDSLTTAGRNFIDTRRLLRAVGLGLLDPRLAKDVIFRREQGKPVLNLDFLLKETAIVNKPLDWDRFVEMQKVQPLHIVASGLKSEKSFVMDMERGSFTTMEAMTDCMHASCLLPGIAGPLMNIWIDGNGTNTNGETRLALGNNVVSSDGQPAEPLADALVYEPMPYRSAVKEGGATHVVVLRTRPDGVDVTGKTSIFERMILRRFFLKKNKLRNIYKRLRSHLHKKLYAEDVIILNEAAKDTRDYRNASSTDPQLMAIAVGPGFPEVTRLEVGRGPIFDGVRRGFARAYDALVEDPSERGRGHIVAREYFPDAILDYDPTEIDSKGQSAFETVLKRGDTKNKFPKSLGKTASEAGAPR
eukprot:CAMPEP_0198304864 /NCGR_PEP_ID=MMETSP1449-20131203/57614_1 /TAXON_ID=420275 /ORGANISM="Attheya septentrionalis, Strain CCMP2084" /LENGTH=681 /DNA_ID=CAMNT_0044007393 /DNA_START=179 /DNA_END=2225 /DNA_ORIENTATION=-